MPAFALPWVGVLGAMAWIAYALLGYSPEVGTFAAAFVVGVAGRLLARYHKAPAALWVVPAILPLLPGLALVVALLASGDLQRFAGIWNAVLIAFALGVGVAAGDIAVAAIVRLRRGIVDPAVDAVATGFGALVSQPIERMGDRGTHGGAPSTRRPRRGRARATRPVPAQPVRPADSPADEAPSAGRLRPPPG